MKRFLNLILFLFVLCGMLYSAGPKFVLVIDPGHGGKDGGAIRNSYKEKEINLKVALALGELIEKNMKDVKIVYTRKTDVFVDLDKRAQIANKAKANLFISIHTNSTASKNTDVSGADTYILGLARSDENLAVAKRENSVILLEDDYTTKYEGFDPNSPESYIIFEFMTNKYMDQSLQFASSVQKDFRAVAKRSDRGVRQAGFLVLRKTSAPSVLIELGFINNLAEAKFLSSQFGQLTMATAIYSGFKKYKQNFDKMQGNLSVSSVVEDMDITQDDNDIVVEEKRSERVNTPSTDTIDKKVISKNTASSVSAVQTVKKRSENQIEYRVQFLYLDVKLPNNSPLFKGLTPVQSYKDGQKYKYTYGSETSLSEILKVQKQVRLKFKDAFVVKFKNGERLK